MFITDRGQPAHVLLTIDDYRRLCGMRETIADLLYVAGADAIDIDFQRPRDTGRAVDFD